MAPAAYGKAPVAGGAELLDVSPQDAYQPGWYRHRPHGVGVTLLETARVV
jgi:hypothetical protein